MSRGASISALSKYKESPCDYAIKRGHKEIALEFKDKMLRLETLKLLRQERDAGNLGDDNLERSFSATYL